MATLETEIRTLLTDDATVTALVSDRVYRRRVPAGGEYPCVVMRRAKTDRLNFSGGVDPLTKVMLSVVCWSNDPDELEDIHDAVKVCIADHTGGTPVKIHECTLLSEADIDGGATAGTDDAIMLGRQLEFLVWYEILAA